MVRPSLNPLRYTLTTSIESVQEKEQRTEVEDFTESAKLYGAIEEWVRHFGRRVSFTITISLK